MHRKKVVFTVTCLDINGSVGQNSFVCVCVFFFFFQSKQLKRTYCGCHYASPAKSGVYKGKRKLKLLITCENFVRFALEQFFIMLWNIILENVEKKIQSGGFREGRSGYRKHNLFISPYDSLSRVTNSLLG